MAAIAREWPQGSHRLGPVFRIGHRRSADREADPGPPLSGCNRLVASGFAHPDGARAGAGRVALRLLTQL